MFALDLECLGDIADSFTLPPADSDTLEESIDFLVDLLQQESATQAQGDGVLFNEQVGGATQQYLEGRAVNPLLHSPWLLWL